MPVLPSRLDLFQVGRTHVIARAKRIDPTVVDTAGSDVNLFVGSSSFLAHACVRQIGAQFAAQTFDGSEDEDLDRVILDRTGGKAPRKGASPAVVQLDLVRPTFTAGGGSIPVNTKVIANGGIEYRTTTQANFAPTDLTSGCDAVAVQAGKEQQVGRNQIRRFANPGALFDPSITVNNPEPAAGGEPREGDDEYRERGKDFFGALSKGVLSAIEFGAKTVPGVASAQAQEAYGQIITGGSFRLPPVAQPARVVTLYIADSSGVANAILARQVQFALVEWRAAGIQVVIYPGLPTLVAVRLRLRFAAGVDSAVLAELIRSAVIEYVNSLQVGKALERGALTALLLRYRNSGLLSGQEAIVEPAGDIVPEPGRTLRTTRDLVTIE